MSVDVNKVSISFGARLVLDQVSAKFRGGEIAAVLGPSGAGKSTLLALVAGYLAPESGYVNLHGVPLSRVGFVAQSTPLMAKRSVLDNVAVGALALGLTYEDATSRAHDLLASLGMSKLAVATAHKISGGERQRVAILRAIAFNSPVLLADEPTASLDADNRAHVCSALRVAANEGVTVIVATHDQFVAGAADRVFTL